MNRKRDLRAFFVLVLVLLAGLLLGPNKADAMVSEDILTMRSANLGDLSTDGRYLLYSITAWDPDSEENRTFYYNQLLDWFDEFVLGQNGVTDEHVESEIND